MKLSIRELIRATGAEIIKGNPEYSEKVGISTDTRTISKEDIYLPLKGENFDGEKIIANSDLKMYFTSTGIINDSAEIVLKVEDTKEAYLKMPTFPTTIMKSGSARLFLGWNQKQKSLL